MSLFIFSLYLFKHVIYVLLNVQYSSRSLILRELEAHFSKRFIHSTAGQLSQAYFFDLLKQSSQRCLQFYIYSFSFVSFYFVFSYFHLSCFLRSVIVIIRIIEIFFSENYIYFSLANLCAYIKKI